MIEVTCVSAGDGLPNCRSVWTGGELDHQAGLSIVESDELSLRNRPCFRKQPQRSAEQQNFGSYPRIQIDRVRTMYSGIGWAESLTIGNVKSGPEVRQTAIGMIMTSRTQATRTNISQIYLQNVHA
jgi:hypothetical protein